MDKNIKYLFEYQKFIKDPKLEEVIKTCKLEEEYEISDESLLAVAGGKTEEQFSKDNDKNNTK